MISSTTKPMKTLKRNSEDGPSFSLCLSLCLWWLVVSPSPSSSSPSSLLLLILVPDSWAGSESERQLKGGRGKKWLGKNRAPSRRWPPEQNIQIASTQSASCNRGMQMCLAASRCHHHRRRRGYHRHAAAWKRLDQLIKLALVRLWPMPWHVPATD